MIFKFFALVFLGIFVFSGCSAISNMDKLLTLKSLGDDQQQMQNYVDKQNKLFQKLLADSKEDRLTYGMSQRKFLRIYGEPVISWKSKRGPAEDVFLYRHPMKYFNSDKVYIYFDSSQQLISYDYQPYAESKK